MNLTCLNEKPFATFQTMQLFLCTVPPEQEDIEAYNENTAIKSLPS